MPTLSVERDLLFQHLGRTYSDNEFDELCFEFGIELDEITSERDEIKKSNPSISIQQLNELYDDTIIYKIDVPANRYDLLCLEGLCRAILIFLGDISAPTYKLSKQNEEPLHTMTVHKTNTDLIRPYVVCAILRDISFTKDRYNSFIDLQDQLHRNLCRQRTLVAIGTHDLDTIAPPFFYNAKPPKDIKFIPLTPSDQGLFQADELLNLYEKDEKTKHLKPYVHIIKNSPVYPVIMDAKDNVLSLPPIINGDHSKITLQTKNVFIECTATDLTKANIVLDTMVTMFSEYCSNQYTVEPVKVQYHDNNGTIINSYITPSLSTRKENASIDFCNSLIGIQLLPKEMQKLCNKVQLGPAELLNNDTILQVTVPPTRSDILHPVDIAEDIGIAYGYNNIIKKIPKTTTVGKEFPLNHFGDLLRDEISRAGYIEVLTHGLCSLYDNFVALRRPIPNNNNNDAFVSLSNPTNIEYQIVRTTLLPGLLKTLQHNKSSSFMNGFKIFEISDVVVPDSYHIMTETIVGAKNVRHLCAIYSGPTSGFEIIHGLVDRIMTLCEIKPDPMYAGTETMKDQNATTAEEKYRISRPGWMYKIVALDDYNNNTTTTTTTTQDNNNNNNNQQQHNDHAITGNVGETYFPGRAAAILLTIPNNDNNNNNDDNNNTTTTTTTITKQVGTFGVLHPEVLSNFDILYPSSCVELDLEALM